MWRLLPLCLLVGCAALEPNGPSDGNSGAAQTRVVRTSNLPLSTSATTIDGKISHKTFQSSGISGRVDSTGFWELRALVSHGRLRCGVYQVGMQLGSGNRGCSEVRWLTDVEYVTRERHCNSASRIHTGDGRFPDARERFPVLTCVRVVVRCERNC
jgi:hypothetical protein